MGGQPHSPPARSHDPQESRRLRHIAQRVAEAPAPLPAVWGGLCEGRSRSYERANAQLTVRGTWEKWGHWSTPCVMGRPHHCSRSNGCFSIVGTPERSPHVSPGKATSDKDEGHPWRIHEGS